MAVQLSNLKATLLEAAQKAAKLEEGVLASHTVAIDYIKPSQFFHNGKELFLGKRFYWKNADNTKVMVGQGLAHTFQSSEPNALFSIEKEWKRLTKQVVMNDNLPEFGPTLFGGISFDEKVEPDSNWSPFSNGLFYVPQFMLSIIEDEKVFLTINLYVQGFENIDQILSKLTAQENQLLSCEEHVKNESFSTTFEEVNPSNWYAQVEEVVDRIQKGEAEKVVLARPVRADFSSAIETATVIERLTEQQTNSYIFVLEALEQCFIGATPERLIVKNREEVKSTCLAGSISRGKTDKEDAHLGNLLLNDEKNRKEHEYVVKRIQNAFVSLCDDVYVPNYPTLLKMKDIQHLYTPVIGRVALNQSILSFVQLLHPTPALGGEPVEEALSIIRQVETWDRGFYGAPIGFVDMHGDGEFAVAIRSALITDRGKRSYLFAGCGIVDSSNPQAEWEETELKLRPMKRAFSGDDLS
ncbi:isochorismate synthase [Mangrovibacillus cuniculi]|uniref:isochorismate synthase n=1 Tax=Mangrovibacillus cuniculi TaxID=2593652 RepID=A0A7S8CC84_9BACI|nr:isochorismate synthase [Mangrovibacillus cuniculi]QPC47320.1 isochorismate synthase [Mangrovibacillus cuniculi]